MSITYEKDHVSVRSQGEIQSICRPLFGQLNLSYFHYCRAYQDGTTFILSNRNDWHDYFWNKKFEMRAPIPDQDLVFDNAKITLWRGGAVQDNVIDDARNLFNFDHPLNITIPQKDYFEMFAFGTHTGNDRIINQYLGSIQTLLHFTHYFRDKADALIREGDRSRKSVPLAQQARELTLLRTAKEEGYNVIGNNGIVNLSAREASIARCLCWGMNANAIASRYHRSTRTIESHINNLKTKLGIRKKSEMISLLMSQVFW